ncbi:FkbM family methyltransferase [Acetivibrio mesophilus]|nr:FkbM family methyltransferase [Acetivibrio mesophilus]ODM26260.1 hypothetical protein A7W90_08490 [Clostridium sp. Bc-iso-3]HHV28099.1 FkbM family methyltransferase [Clostridium sp.]
MGETNIVELYKKAFSACLDQKQKLINSSNQKKQLSEFIPFYEEDKSFYEEIKQSYDEWKASGEILISAGLLKQLSDVYSALQDEESKNVFHWYIQSRIAFTILEDTDTAEQIYPYPTKNKKYTLAKLAAKKIKKEGNLFIIDGYSLDSELYLVSESWICETYLLEGKCEPKKGDIIIDAGAYKGETAVWFADKTQGYGKVYSFEVLPSHVSAIERNIKINKLEESVQVIKKGLWDRNTTIRIIESGDATKCTPQEGQLEIEVITLDSFVKENDIKSVDFIKMDIEGAELKALKGSIDTIKTFKPKLAICVYHKYMDIVEIPLWLKSIVPEYKIYLGQKTPSPHSLVLYASI